MTKNILIYIILFFGGLSEGLAQHAYFPIKGKITFEKEVYVKARMRDMQNRSGNRNPGMMNRWGGNIDDMPEKNSSMFVLQFDEDETLMMPQDVMEGTTSSSPGRLPPPRVMAGGRGGMRTSGGFGGQQKKVYYQNFKTGETEIELEIDEKYLLKDSLQNITWRFTDEYRNIAGYECRRVNGATADSLYIVAFYTDQIPLSGGPVLVNGLPGMILGLAIPEMHINYWARQVDFTVDNVSKQWRDKKNKELTVDEFFKSLTNNRAFGNRNNSRSQIRRNILEGLIY